jgi:hypothetical protein
MTTETKVRLTLLALDGAWIVAFLTLILSLLPPIPLHALVLALLGLMWPVNFFIGWRMK